MSLDTEIFSALGGFQGLSDLVGARIYPVGTVPAQVAKPYVTWQEITDTAVQDLDGTNGGSGGLDRYRVAITTWDLKRTTARAVALQVRLGMEAASAYKALHLDRRDVPFEPDTKLNGIQQDFAVWLRS